MGPSASVSSASKTAITIASARKPTSVTTTGIAARPASSSSGNKTPVANGTVPPTRSLDSGTRTVANNSSSDAKKKPSTLGSLSTVSKPASRPATATPVSTKEAEELKAKLHERQKKLEELQAEIDTTREQLHSLEQRLEDQASAATEAQKQIREEHNVVIGKLEDDHKAEIENLAAQLSEAHSADSSAAELAATLKKCEDEHAASLAALTVELDTVKEGSANHLSVKETELGELKLKLEKSESEILSITKAREALQAELVAKSKEMDDGLSALKKSITEEHEATLISLKTSHQAEIDKLASENSTTYDERLKELVEKYEHERNSLQEQLEEAQSSSLKKHEASARLEAELDELKASSEEDKKALAATNSELASITDKFQTTQNDFIALSEKHTAIQAKVVKDEEALAAGNEEIAKIQQEVMSLQKMMDAVDEEGKSREELHNKLKADLAAALKNLDEVDKEMSAIQEKHRKELETVSTDYEKEIAALEGESGFKDKYEKLNRNHEELVKTHGDTVDSFEQTLKKLQSDHDAALQTFQADAIAHDQALEAIKATHAKDLDEAHDKAIVASDTTHAAELKEVQESYSATINTLKEQHEAALENLTSEIERRKAAEIELQAEIARTAALIQEANSELDALKLELVVEKSAKVTAQAELDAALNKRPDNSELEGLRKTLKALKEQHEAALSSAEQNLIKATEDNISAKEELIKVQAERDASLSKKPDTTEADNLRKDLENLREEYQATLAATKEESSKAIEEHAAALKKVQTDLEVALSKGPDTSEVDTLHMELQTLKDQHQAALIAAQQEAARASEEHVAALVSLEKAQAELVSQMDASENKSKTFEEDYKSMHDLMTQLVEEANKKATDKDAVIAELEAKMKVRDAELAEAKAKAVDVQAPRTPVKTAGGLSSSRFATGLGESMTDGFGVHDEPDNSSAALASLAAAKVTLTQLEDMNADLKAENLRMLKSITEVSEPEPLSPSRAGVIA